MSAGWVVLLQWALLWLLGLAALRASYPLWRTRVLCRHPADAGDILLCLFWLPALLGGLLVLTVHRGGGGYLLSHCHGALCGPHVPQLDYATYSVVPALVLGLSVLGKLLWEWARYRRYWRWIAALAQPKGQWWVLPDTRPVAFTLGFFRPRLVASQGLLECLDREALDIIAAHEHAHRDRGDNLRALAARAALLPLLPICRPLLEALELCHEQACDLRACRVSEPARVAQTIVDVMRLHKRHWRGPLASFFGAGHSEARVRALLHEPASASGSWPLRSGFLLVAAVLFALALDPVHHLLESLW